ncbi:hypothetical protein [Cupriavidus taiwanensis]|uniref:Uncharacterized protein n=1 Tax=Cupriavidus taiwanensis TaxID=164546 RepID=A0A375J6V2_9BURK|nr:hypothetical protein [Cupriavidus taiwanensis]SPS00894.1 hypothetical protein CBM2634_B170221 [Cupriavidus taiwanensis]
MPAALRCPTLGTTTIAANVRDAYLQRRRYLLGQNTALPDYGDYGDDEDAGAEPVPAAPAAPAGTPAPAQPQAPR